jgi:hypothetical protein
LVKEVDYLVRRFYAQMFAVMVKVMSEKTFEHLNNIANIWA